jgi:hypothetical protein
MTKKSLGFMAAALMLSVSYAPAAPNKASEEIDRLVFEKLASLNIPPSSPCTDEVFLRRVYLDMIGTLPTKEEARRFLDSKSLNKRSDLIEDLFKRDEFADYWSMKWCDLLREQAMELQRKAVSAKAIAVPGVDTGNGGSAGLLIFKTIHSMPLIADR